MAGWGFGTNLQRRTSVLLDVRKKLLIGAIWVMDAHHCMLWGKTWILIATLKCLRLIFSLFHSARRSIIRMVPDGGQGSHLSSCEDSIVRSAGIRTLNWPARSTDLKTIEHMWSLVKQHVRWSRTPGTSCYGRTEACSESYQESDLHMRSWVRKAFERREDESSYLLCNEV